MIPNPLLAITIPTYNRADFLDYSLERHIPIAKEKNIQIFISDNHSTDHTKEIVEKWQSLYPLLYYSCNECNVGEINFEIALKLPDTEYIWLLGDTYQIPSTGIDSILETIKKKDYDALIVNLANQLHNISQTDYSNQNALLQDIGALMTCLSCLIYHKSLIEKGNFSRYYNTFFIQTGIIFEDISDRTFCIHWAQSISIENLIHPSLRKSNWSLTSKAFEIGCEKWTNFIFSLPPAYTLESKMKCISDFGNVSRLFTVKNLVLLRFLNILNLSTYLKYRSLFRLTINKPLLLLFLLSITPKFLFQLVGILAIPILGCNKFKRFTV